MGLLIRRRSIQSFGVMPTFTYKPTVLFCLCVICVHLLLVLLTVGKVGAKVDGNYLQQLSIATKGQQSRYCNAGHVDGFKPVCGRSECLKRLEKPDTFYQSLLPRTQLSQDHWDRISVVPGQLDNIQASFLTSFVRLQWKNGVFGSVGEVGVHFGKFTGVLALNTDTQAGERLFVADQFRDKLDPTMPISQYELFIHNMMQWDFYWDASGPARRLYVERGGFRNLDNKMFSTLALPQFRLFSIDEKDPGALLDTLVKVSCVIREGAVVIISNFDRKHSQVLQSLRQYFHLYGKDILTPLIVVNDKLYLTTAKWRLQYTRQFQSDSELLILLKFHEVTNFTFGPRLTYLTNVTKR